MDTTILGIGAARAKEEPFIASMGIYVFKKQVLLDLLNKEYPQVGGASLIGLFGDFCVTFCCKRTVLVDRLNKQYPQVGGASMKTSRLTWLDMDVYPVCFTNAGCRLSLNVLRLQQNTSIRMSFLHIARRSENAVSISLA